MRLLTRRFCVISMSNILLLLSGNLATAAAIEEVVVKGKVLYADQVTALKTPVAVIDVPQSLSILTEEEMLRQGFTAIEDIISYIPGTNTSQGEGHRDAVVFRGIRSTADFYVDGVRDDVQYYRSLYNLEQVEILRGPNALLFGRGGSGGVLNRVSKKGQIGPTFGAINAASDSFGAHDLTADYNHSINDTSAVRLNLQIEALDNHRDSFNGDRYGLNPSLRIAISPATTLDLSYEFADHEHTVDRGIPTLDGRPDATLKDITFGTEETNKARLKANIYRAYLSHSFSDSSKGNLVLQASDFEKFYRNLYASDYDEEFVEIDGYADSTERQQQLVAGNLVNEFRTGSIEHTLLSGMEWIQTDNINARNDTLWTDSQRDKERFAVSRPMNFSRNAEGRETLLGYTPQPVNHTRSDVEVASIFVQDQVSLSSTIKLMIGGRLDHFDIAVTDRLTNQTESRADKVFSPRGGLIYKPAEQLSLYLSYSETFLPRSGEQFKKLSASAARLDPDVFESQELGLKWDFYHDISMALAIFKSEQTQAVRDSNSGETSEIVGLQVKGFEFEVKGHVSDALYLSAGFSRLEGETSVGGEPREIPDFTASLWARYQMNERLSFSLGAIRQGDAKIANNRPDFILPGYSRLDLGIEYDLSPSLSLQLQVENVLDTLYFPHAHSIHQASVGEPINARLQIRKQL